jgi:hypothetical protein
VSRCSHAAATLAVAAVLATAACGRKSGPVAPELVRPQPATDLTAAAAADGVRLRWVRPLHYTGGGRMNDLGGFVIERAPGEGEAPVFHRIGTHELHDQERFQRERRVEWTDRDVVPGSRYLYRVVAVTLDGSRSAPAGPVALRYQVPTTPAEGATP